MNKVIDELFKRKSVRVFENKEVEEEVKNTILNCALQAPTAGNMMLYSIIDIKDNEEKEKLSILCDNQKFIADAPMVFVFCADYRRWYKAFEKVSHEKIRKPGEGDMFLANCDAIIAAQNTVVAAEALGMGSCYIGDIIENYEQVKELLKLPKYVIPTCMVIYGYPTKQQSEREKPKRFTIEDIVHENTYNASNDNIQLEMLAKVTGKTMEECKELVEARRKRKWDCEFSKEMTRSSKAIIKSWCE